MDALSWVFTGLAIIGTFLNAKRNRNGFICWMLSDAYLMGLNMEIEQYAQSFLFFIFLLLACYGYYEWKQNKDENL